MVHSARLVEWLAVGIAILKARYGGGAFKPVVVSNVATAAISINAFISKVCIGNVHIDAVSLGFQESCKLQRSSAVPWEIGQAVLSILLRCLLSQDD